MTEIIQKKNHLNAQTEQLLTAAGLRRTYAGWGYLLDAADLIGQGAEIGVPLLQEIAARRGRTYTQVRRGIRKAAEVLYARPEGQALLGTRPEPLDVWAFLAKIMELAKKTPEGP